MISLSYYFRIGATTVSEIISETCEAIWTTLKSEVFITPSEESWLQIANDFNKQWNFPNCIGALDGKHVVIQALPHSGSQYYNYKGSHSLVLMALCDANYCFTVVDIGGQGRHSDGGIFKNSEMGKAFENNLLHIPKPTQISDEREPVPYVIVADEAFALTTYMMRPFPRSHLNNKQRIFNYRLSRARRIIENSFGMWVARFRIFRKPIIASLTTAESIIKASVCLHNWLMRREPQQCATEGRHFNTAILRTQATALQEVSRSGSNMYSQNAAHIRNTFTEYFYNEGAVEWQWERAAQ